MKTPEQIRDMEFQKSPMGGYKQSDVELFLEEVASQIEILMKQKAESGGCKVCRGAHCCRSQLEAHRGRY